MGVTSNINQDPIAVHELEIGKLTLYPNIIVGEVADGVHLTFENATVAAQIMAQEYKDTTPFVYISNRVNSFSMDPVAYKDLFSVVPNIQGMAIVAKSKKRRMLSNLERIFIKKPMRVFSSMDEALDWSNKLLKNKN